MAIIKTETKDRNGAKYIKIFSNFDQGAIVCFNEINDRFDVKPNISIRSGGSGMFGDEVVLQLTINKKLERYIAGTKTNHIETYFKLNKQTLEFFEGIVELLKKEIKDGL